MSNVATWQSLSAIASPRALDYRHPSNGRTEFFFVRHGRTDGNVRKVLVGRTDISLDALGCRQAIAVAEHFAKAVPPDVIVTSPLKRARETAQAIADRLSLPVEIEDDLAELNFGSYEGWSFDDIIAHEPEFAAQFRDIEIDAHWPGGERLSAFHNRVRSVVDTLAIRYASHTAIVVAHGGVLGSLVSQLLNTPPNDWARYQLHNCSVTHLVIGENRSMLHRLNDVAHLATIELEQTK